MKDDALATVQVDTDSGEDARGAPSTALAPASATPDALLVLTDAAADDLRVRAEAIRELDQLRALEGSLPPVVELRLALQNLGTLTIDAVSEARFRDLSDTGPAWPAQVAYEAMGPHILAAIAAYRARLAHIVVHGLPGAVPTARTPLCPHCRTALSAIGDGRLGCENQECPSRG